MQKNKFHISRNAISGIRKIVYKFAAIRFVVFHGTYLLSSALLSVKGILGKLFTRNSSSTQSQARFVPPENGQNQLLPKVSLIIPFHNTSEYLEAAISSALASKGVELELILVDDGSDRATGEIASHAAITWKNVKLIKQQRNRGAYFSRNLAMLEAKGDYIAFLDSDDVQDEYRLAKQIRALEEHSAHVSLCNHCRWDVELENVLSKPSPFIISMVFKRSLVNEVGFFHCVRWGADREYLKRIERIKGKSAVVKLSEDLIAARLRPGSLTTSPGSSFLRSSTWRRSVVAVPSRDRLLYRAEYAYHHRRASSQFDLFLDFPFESLTLAPIGASHQSEEISRDAAIVLIFTATGENRPKGYPNRSEASFFLTSNFNSSIRLPQQSEWSPELKDFLNSSGEYIILVESSFKANPNLLRRLLTQAMDLSVGEALLIKSGNEHGFLKTTQEAYLKLREPGFTPLISDDEIQVAIGRVKRRLSN